ncbi:MAG TPA: SDR family oxidoreductase [Burkholderiaceae bacterium]|nr:SDR family oxidoreductase [Burkholderiaceae bacterium]
MNASRLSVVTGGASGIGLACVRQLVQRGDRVVVLDLPDSRLAPDLEREGVQFVACDVLDEASVAAAAAEVEDRIGAVAVLVNSAGIIQPRLAPEALDMALWDRVVGVDLRGTYLSCVAFGTRMAARGSGAIVNIASIVGSRSAPLHVYAPAKAAVISLTRCLATEWGRSGVRVNCVSPGYTQTPALQAAIDRGDRDPAELVASTALGRMVDPQEVACGVAFLASDAASAITGVDLPIDAGWLVGTSWHTYGGVPAARPADSPKVN